MILWFSFVHLFNIAVGKNNDPESQSFEFLVTSLSVAICMETNKDSLRTT
jgi:hypothetical protein